MFAARGVRRVPLPLCVHPDRPWLLLDDAGPTLRKTRLDSTGDHDLAAWERILAEYAELQRSLDTNDAVEAMLGAGTPDGRPAALPGELARLLDDDAWWERLTDEEREDGAAARRTLREQLPVVTAQADELDALGIAASVQHDDLHGGNVLVGPDGDRFFDWGDATVAHPFSTLTVTFNSIAHTLELQPDDAVFTRLEAVYLAAWDGVGAARRPPTRRNERSRSRLYRPGAGLGALAQRARGRQDGRVRRRCCRVARRIRRPHGPVRRYSMTSPSGRSTGFGYCGSSSWSVSPTSTPPQGRGTISCWPGRRTTAHFVDVFEARPRRRRCSRPSACAPRGRRARTSSASSGRRARLEPLQLLVLVDVQEELDDGRPVGSQGTSNAMIWS